MKNLKFIKMLLFVFLMMFTLTACSTPKTEGNLETPTEVITETPTEAITEAPTTEVTLPTTDRAGNEITIPDTINTIVSMSPSTTEILLALGLEDKIIAADTQTQGYGLLPNVTTYFDMMTPDAEQIIALNPDIVYVSTMSIVGDVNPFKPLIDAGICVAYVPSSESILGIYDDITFLADSLQLSDKGNELISAMKTTIEEIQTISASIVDKKSVYFEIGAAPYMYSFGTGTFLNEMIDIIGANNVLGKEAGWISVSEEVALAANPDVILTNVNYIEGPIDEIKAREGWDTVSAVANNEVFYVDNKYSSLPNQNIILALEQMAEAIYPDAFPFE